MSILWEATEEARLWAEEPSGAHSVVELLTGLLSGRTADELLAFSGELEGQVARAYTR